jgi:hypothetical protein
MCFKIAAIRVRRATLRQSGKGFSIPLAMVAAVTLMALAGCDTPGAGVESEGPSMAGEGGVAHPDAVLQTPEEKAMDNAPEVPGNGADTMSSTGGRGAPVTAAPSDGAPSDGAPSGGVDWGADRHDSDAKNRLIAEEKRLQGRIRTLDLQLRAFDANPPSRAARESDPRGRPESIERRLNVERNTLEAQVRQVRRELQWLRMESSPTSTSAGSRGTSSPSLFGGFPSLFGGSDPP